MDKTIKDKIDVCKNCGSSETAHPYGDLYCDVHKKTCDAISECNSNPYMDIETDKDIKEEKTYPVELTFKQYRALMAVLPVRAYTDIRVKIDETLKKIDEPQIGDRCAFWNEDKSDYIIGYLESIDNSRERYSMASSKNDVKDNIPLDCFKNCVKIKKEAEF